MKTQYNVVLVEAGKETRSSIFEAASEKDAAQAAAATWRVPTHKLGTQLYFAVRKLGVNVYDLK
jgi:hypothetical protein